MGYQNLLNFAGFKPLKISTPGSWVGHIPFAAGIITIFRPRIFVELGTHTGNSYFSFCQAVKESDLPTKCYAVDTWKGDEHAGLYGNEVFDSVDKFHREHFNDFSKLIRSTFDDAVSNFADKSIDLLHIDGMHTYEDVKHDFETWFPKLSDSAIVVFHDTNVRERNFGVWKFWEEICSNYPYHMEFKHSSGLGVVQISDTDDGPTIPWLSATNTDHALIKNYFTFLGEQLSENFTLQSRLAECEAELVALGGAGKLTEMNKQLHERYLEVQEKDRLLHERNLEVQEKDRLLHERNLEVREKDRLLHERHLEVQEKDRLLDQRNHEVQEKDRLLDQSNKYIEENKLRLATLETTVHEKEEELQNCRDRIKNLEESLSKIHNSFLWKLSGPFRRMTRPGKDK